MKCVSRQTPCTARTNKTPAQPLTRRCHFQAQSPPTQRDRSHCRTSATSANTTETSQKPGTDASTGLRIGTQAETPVQQRSPQQSFQWTKHWYPISLVADLDRHNPNLQSLLDINIVIWQDGDEQWGACQDRCPHRLAPLSEGRLHNGHLTCNYHGWEFDVKGTCLKNPQASQQIQQSVCTNDRARAAAYPTKVAQGMLWVWPESGPHAWLESAMTDPELIPEMVDPSLAGSDTLPGVQTWSSNWDVLLENTMDPSHACFLHDGIAGKWEEAAPLTMHLKHNQFDMNQGFAVEHDGYSTQQQADGLKVMRQFQPPCTLRYEYSYNSGRIDYFGIHFVPLAPGITRSFFKLTSKNAPKGFDFISRVPPWLIHNLGAGLNDQDAIMLHGQDRALKDDKLQWQDYFLASPADRGVMAFRQWLNDKAGGDVGWVGGATSRDLPPPRTRQQLLSRWERHTKDCASCKQAMATIDKVRTALTAASAALLLAALFTTAQYRSAISDSALLELSGSAAMLAIREGLRRFNEGFITRTSSKPVYNFRKKAAQQ